MTTVIVLDSTPLGILCHPRSPPPVLALRQWLADLRAAGRRVVVPEIADYEVRRELIRAGRDVALANLDSYGLKLEFISVTNVAMRQAAKLWAYVRNAGLPTAPEPALDADVILAAQALSLNTNVIVATANPRHLARFVPAEHWLNIML